MDKDYTRFINNILWQLSHNIIQEFPLEYALQHCVTIQNGWVGEFGVYSGNTLKLIRNNTPSNIPVIGFDTFTGLPSDWREGYLKGSFDMHGDIPHILDNVGVFKGLFSVSIPPLVNLLKMQPARLLHIDCDIYDGANDVFTLLQSCIVPGTVIVFDELVEYRGFEKHEMKAFYELIQRTNLNFQVVGGNGERVIILIK